MLHNVLRRSTRCPGRLRHITGLRAVEPATGVRPSTGAGCGRRHSGPVTVLVHGGKGSGPGAFARWRSRMPFAAGQAVSFSYDDRASLVRSSGDLITALEGLCGQGRNREAPARTTPRQSL